MIVRLGQDHWRAKLTDREVEVIRELLAERQALVAALRAAGAVQSAIDRALLAGGLSYRCIAVKLEVSKSLVRFIDAGKRRP